MKKKKLELNNLKVKSFVTTLGKNNQTTLIGGNDTTTLPTSGKRSVLLECPSNQDPFACGRTDGDDCEGLITDDLAVCGGMLI